jgi:hypothetical protein
MSASDITRIIRRPATRVLTPAEIDADPAFDMSVEAMGIPALPGREERCQHCYERGFRGGCPECVRMRAVFASIPTRSRALVGGVK